jgi:hypothetical protein
MSEIGIPYQPGEGDNDQYEFLPGPTYPPDTGTEPDVGGTEPEPGPAPTPVPPEPETDLGEGLPDLNILALLLAALGLAALAKALSDFLNWLNRTFLGRLFRQAGSPQVTPEQITQPLTNALGQQVTPVDSQLGTSFTKLGQLVAQLGTWIKTETQIAATLARKQRALEGHVSASTARANAAGQEAAAAAATAAGAVTKAQTTATAAAQAEHAQGSEIDQLTEHVHHVIEPELEALRHAIPELQKGATATWDELAKHSEALGLAGLTAGVATVLGRLGAGWTTCDNNGALGKAYCGMPGNLMRDLLAALAVIAAGTFTLEELAKWGLSIIGTAEGAVTLFWSVDLHGPNLNPGLGSGALAKPLRNNALGVSGL